MHGRLRDQPALPWQGRSQPAAQSSYEAARAAAETSPELCVVLRRYLRDRGTQGATDAEIELALGWPPNVVTARRNDLVARGEVVVRWPDARRESVKAPRRPGGRRLRVTVWMASEFGRIGETSA
jgi:hypothetical protein